MNKKIDELIKNKGRENITGLTAYDYPTAKLVEEAGIDFILVGDSLGVVVLGYENPLSVDMAVMLHHSRAVCRGANNIPIIGDMPVNSYRNPNIALKNAQDFMDTGVDGVKIEGMNIEIVKKLVKNDIPVMGHLGLTPQTIEEYSVQGRDAENSKRILREAQALAKAGVFSIVLECISEGLGDKITRSIDIPTIGIGAGRYTDGQILVINDLLGLFDRYSPKFVKQYIDLRSEIRSAIIDYKVDVKKGKFPGKENIFK